MQRLKTENTRLELALSQLSQEHGALGIEHDRLKKDFSTLAKETSLIQRQIPLQQLKADRAVQKLVEHTQGESGYRKRPRAYEEKYEKVCQSYRCQIKKLEI